MVIESDNAPSLLECADREGFDVLAILAVGHYVLDLVAFRNCARILVQENKSVCLNKGSTDQPLHFIDSLPALINLHWWRSNGRPEIMTDSNFDLARLPIETDYNHGNLRTAWREAQECCLRLESRPIASPALAIDGLKHLVRKWGKQVWFRNTEPLLMPLLETQSVPCDTFVSVASGLKPNVILNGLGFTNSTRVVFFDASPRALAFRKWLVENWNGFAYDRAVATWLSRNSAYRPWQKVDEDLTEFFDQTTRLLGGPQQFARHWTKYKQLSHEYVRADIVGFGRKRVVQTIAPTSKSPAIWWSNIFHSLYTHALLTPAQAKLAYQTWLHSLFRRNRNLLCYGTDDEGTETLGLVPPP